MAALAALVVVPVAVAWLTGGRAAVVELVTLLGSGTALLVVFLGGVVAWVRVQNTREQRRVEGTIWKMHTDGNMVSLVRGAITRDGTWVASDSPDDQFEWATSQLRAVCHRNDWSVTDTSDVVLFTADPWLRTDAEEWESPTNPGAVELAALKLAELNEDRNRGLRAQLATYLGQLDLDVCDFTFGETEWKVLPDRVDRRPVG